MYIPGFSVLDLAFNCVFSELQGVRERLGNLEAVRLPQLEARLADAAAGRPSQDLLESLHGYLYTPPSRAQSRCRLATSGSGLDGPQQTLKCRCAG